MVQQVIVIGLIQERELVRKAIDEHVVRGLRCGRRRGTVSSRNLDVIGTEASVDGFNGVVHRDVDGREIERCRSSRTEWAGGADHRNRDGIPVSYGVGVADCRRGDERTHDYGYTKSHFRHGWSP
jgi:hypothetical protein